MNIKNKIKKLINKFGLDVRRFQSNASFEAQIVAAMKKVKIDTLFDIGANTGQFAQKVLAAGYNGKIISFEPLSSAHNQLSKSAQNNTKWIVHPRTAVGDHDGKIEINIAGNSVSSSVLPMLKAHLSAAVTSAYVGKELSPIIRLDSVAEQYLDRSKCLFIKVDTQGFEWQVLDGAIKTLKQAKGVQLELSLVPLYDGQKLWLEIIARMEKEGFILWSIQKGLTEPKTGQTLQVDVIFVRKEKINI